MRIQSVVALAAALSMTPTLEAQITGRIAPGDRVRVTSPRTVGKQVLTVTAIDSGRVTAVGASRRDTVTFSPGEVDRLEVSLGRRGRGEAAIGGAGRGFLIGAVAGGILGFATGEDCTNGNFLCYTPTEGAAAFGLVFGGLGGVTGAIVGALSGVERWQRVDLVRQVSIAPAPGGGVAIGLSHAF